MAELGEERASQRFDVASKQQPAEFARGGGDGCWLVNILSKSLQISSGACGSLEEFLGNRDRSVRHSSPNHL